MGNHYFESRHLYPSPTGTLAADIARHLQARQYLGKVIIVCEHPLAMLSAMRKQWLRLARVLHNQRARTLNAEEILRFTHAIMHMQNVHFSTKDPTEVSDADIYFTMPQHLPSEAPDNCYTLYITVPTPAKALRTLLGKIAPSALVVAYNSDITAAQFNLLPKADLEAKAITSWQQLAEFLEAHGIQPAQLVKGLAEPQIIDSALDTLLNVSEDFLHAAAWFRHVLDLAQPLASLTGEQIRLFEIVTRLAHRVQSLAPGEFSDLMQGGNSSLRNTFFLRDIVPMSAQQGFDEIFAETELDAPV